MPPPNEPRRHFGTSVGVETFGQRIADMEAKAAQIVLKLAEHQAEALPFGAPRGDRGVGRGTVGEVGGRRQEHAG
ncbi:MAG: hypothetical protein HY907_00745 [Deltaproteobacteria bacterium]|nr:hypothetical protein [Deltaproteobacteria bacterium]